MDIPDSVIDLVKLEYIEVLKAFNEGSTGYSDYWFDCEEFDINICRDCAGGLWSIIAYPTIKEEDGLRSTDTAFGIEITLKILPYQSTINT